MKRPHRSGRPATRTTAACLIWIGLYTVLAGDHQLDRWRDLTRDRPFAPDRVLLLVALVILCMSPPTTLIAIGLERRRAVSDPFLTVLHAFTLALVAIGVDIAVTAAELEANVPDQRWIAAIAIGASAVACLALDSLTRMRNGDGNATDLHRPLPLPRQLARGAGISAIVAAPAACGVDGQLPTAAAFAFYTALTGIWLIITHERPTASSAERTERLLR